MPEEKEQGQLSPEEMEKLMRSMGIADEGNPAQVAAGGENAAAQTQPSPSEPAKPFDFEEIKPSQTAGDRDNIDLLMDVNMDVKVELGRTRMLVEDVLKLRAGSVVELNKLAGDPVEIMVNDRLIARGEVVVLNENFCVRIVEILPQEGRTPD